MVVKRKVALMTLHSHLVKTQNYNWANCLLRYMHGYKIDNWELWVINLALRLANLSEYQIPEANKW